MVPGNEKNHKGMPSLNANAVFELLRFLREKIFSLGIPPPSWAQGISDKCARCLKSGWMAPREKWIAECHIATSVKSSSLESTKLLGFRHFFGTLLTVLDQKTRKLEMTRPEALHNSWKSRGKLILLGNDFVDSKWCFKMRCPNH